MISFGLSAAKNMHYVADTKIKYWSFVLLVCMAQQEGGN